MEEEKENAPSVYSTKLKEAIESIPQELYSMSELRLREKINPNHTLYEIKRAFWEELWFAQESGNKMRLWRVYDGKVSKAYFFKSILGNPYKMAWITSPLVSYEDKAKAALDRVTERYSELVSMEITSKRRIKNAEGEWEIIEETDPKKALVLLQVIKNLEDRIKGTAVQRQISVNATSPDGQRAKSVSLDMDAVNDRLIELEQQLNGVSYGEKEKRKATGSNLVQRRDVQVDIEKIGRIEGRIDDIIMVKEVDERVD